MVNLCFRTTMGPFLKLFKSTTARRTLNHSISLTFLFPLALAPASMAQTAAFTYQGRLMDGSQPANGNYDLRFTLVDAPTNGTLVSAPLTNAPLAISDGLFVVTLDFGANVFDGLPRWLEIAVRTNGGSGPYSVLSPRQRITVTPYAGFANAAGTSAIDGGSPAGTSAIKGSLFSSNAVTLAGLVSGNGGGLYNTTATNLLGSALHATNQFGALLSMAGLLPTPAMVWNSYASWDAGQPFTHFPGEYESNFVWMVQTMRTNGLLAAGYNIAWLDYFWGDRPTLADTLTNDTFKFPNGIPWLANVSHTNGFRFGIYLCWGDNTGGNRPTTSPDAVGRDIALFANWGVDAVKFDGTISCNYTNYTDRDAVVLVANCIRATGRNMILDMTCPHSDQAPDDSIPPSAFPIDIPFNAQIWELSSVQELTTSVDQIMRAANYFEPIAWANGPGHCGQLVWVYQKDAWLVQLTNGLNFDVMWPSPLMIGSWTSALQYYTNAELIAIDQDPAVIPHSILYSNSQNYIWGRPLGLPPNPIPSLDRTYRRADTNAILFINANKTGGPVALTVTSAMLKQPTNTLFWVRDPWQQADAGSCLDTFTVSLPANSTALYVLTKAPWTNAPKAGQVLKFDGTFMYWANP
jgi:hypothetical protein